MKSSSDKNEQSIVNVCSSAKLSGDNEGFGPISPFFTKVITGTPSSMGFCSLNGA